MFNVSAVVIVSVLRPYSGLVIMGLSTTDMIFLGLPRGLGPPAGAFCFDNVSTSKGNSTSNVAPCLASLIDGALAMTSCFVCEA